MPEPLPAESFSEEFSTHVKNAHADKKELGRVGKETCTRLETLITSEQFLREITGLKESLRKLVEIDSPEILEILLRLAGHENKKIRRELVKAVAGLKKHPDARIRQNVAQIFSETGLEEALDQLREMHADEDETVRLNVAKGLGQRGTQQDVETLSKMLADGEIRVVDTALQSLFQARHPSALVILLRTLAETRDEGFRDAIKNCFLDAVEEQKAFITHLGKKMNPEEGQQLDEETIANIALLFSEPGITRFFDPVSFEASHEGWEQMANILRNTPKRIAEILSSKIVSQTVFRNDEGAKKRGAEHLIRLLGRG